MLGGFVKSLGFALERNLKRQASNNIKPINLISITPPTTAPLDEEFDELPLELDALLELEDELELLLDELVLLAPGVSLIVISDLPRLW